MLNKCFYCADEVEEKQVHQVTFLTPNMEREETLCHECYREWLQGIKG